jgi:ketosteroid isomerase-like protein
MSINDVADQFVTAINQHNVQKLVELMTEDHRFIDSMGEIYTGRIVMKKGWEDYFKMVPDYLIEVSEEFVSGNTVVYLGKAKGTYTSDGNLKTENRWETLIALKAVISGVQVKEWQVIADNEPIRAVIKKESGQV